LRKLFVPEHLQCRMNVLELFILQRWISGVKMFFYA